MKEKWLTKKQFEAIDLRDQLNKLKQKGIWYVNELLDRGNLKVFKHHVVYDEDFKFEMKYHAGTIAKATEDRIFKNDVYINGIKEFNKGDGVHIEKGEILSFPYITVTENNQEWEDYTSDDGVHFYDYDDLGESPKNILNDILHYCYHCI